MTKRLPQLSLRTVGLLFIMSMLLFVAFAGTGADAASVLTYDAPTKTATLHLIAGETDVNGGLNFNGHHEGTLIVTVPSGWNVNVEVENETPIPHYVMIAPWEQRLLGADQTPAFAGAAVPGGLPGVTMNDGVESFRFKADKPGKYAVLSATPGQSVQGMWAEFNVIRGLDEPSYRVLEEPVAPKMAPITAETDASGASDSGSGPVVEVTIKNFAYLQNDIEVPVGTTVVWTNEDMVAHNVAFDPNEVWDGQAPVSEMLSKGESYRYTFTEVGEYSYICTPHPFMIGQVTVVPAEEGGDAVSDEPVIEMRHD